MVLQLNIKILQGNVVTDLRQGDRFYSSFFCSSCMNTKVKELGIKIDLHCKSYHNDIGCTYSMEHNCIIQTIAIEACSLWIRVVLL